MIELINIDPGLLAGLGLYIAAAFAIAGWPDAKDEQRTDRLAA